jgi:hypothetical protein
MACLSILKLSGQKVIAIYKNKLSQGIFELFFMNNKIDITFMTAVQIRRA